MKVNILHVIPSPRANVPAVLNYQRELPFDRFIPYFLKEVDAYALARDYFLEHKEYTHFAVGTDDIVVKPEHILHLAKDLEETDYPILSGVMNVYQEDWQYLNICKNLVSPRWYDRYYDWIPRKDLPKYTQDGPIIPVAFSGFPLMIIRRDVVEKIPFYSDNMYNDVSYKDGGSLDVQFCYNARREGFEIHADTRVFMEHLRMSGTIRVNKVKPVCVLWKPDGTKQIFDVQF